MWPPPLKKAHDRTFVYRVRLGHNTNMRMVLDRVRPSVALQSVAWMCTQTMCRGVSCSRIAHLLVLNNESTHTSSKHCPALHNWKVFSAPKLYYVDARH